MSNDNLYFDTNLAENAVITEEDTTSARSSNVKNQLLFRDARTGEPLVGTMPINEPQTIKINPKCAAYSNNTYVIPEGYHNGTGIVYVGDLSEYTPAATGPEDVANNKFFWANGEKLVGTLNTDALEQDATATPDKIIQDFTAWVNGEKITGTIPTILRMDQNLEAGQSYTIPYGLSYGTTIISALPLDIQTPGTATEEDISIGRIAWVNGEEITGTFDKDDYVRAKCIETDALQSEVLYGRKFYSVLYDTVIEGTMPDHSGEERQVIPIGEPFYPEGYYDGGTAITTQTLAEATISNALPSNIVVNRTAWVNGTLVEGTMPYHTPETVEINPDNPYTIPEGYHTGYGKVIAPGVIDTPGTATPDDILEGKTAWVEGEQLTGTIPVRDIESPIRVYPGSTKSLDNGHYPEGAQIYAIRTDLLDLTYTDAANTSDELLLNTSGYVNPGEESIIVTK